MSVKKLSLLLGSVFLVLGASPALAVPAQVSHPIYEWRTEEAADDTTGAFKLCSVVNKYDNDALLILAENNSGQQRLALHFPVDKMREGQTYDLTLQVDKGDVFPVDAVATTSKVMNIAVPPIFLDQLRKGQQLFLRGPKDEVVYTLRGIDGAVTALRDCVASSKNKNYQKSDTQIAETAAMPEKKAAEKPNMMQRMFSPSETKVAETPVVAPMPVENVKAPVIEKPGKALLPDNWNTAFEKAGLAPTTLNKRMSLPLDYAWQKNDLSLGVKQNAAKGTLEQNAVDFLRQLKSACHSSSFVAESSPVQKDEVHQMQWQLVETACSDKKGDTITALFFMTAHGQDSVVMIEGPAAKGAEIIRARNTVLKNLN